jgi:hypothetical protein
VIAVSWLSRSSMKEVGNQLIAQRPKFFTRRLVWLIGVVVALLWLWLAGSSS